MKNKIYTTDGTGQCLEFDALSIALISEAKEDASTAQYYFELIKQGGGCLAIIGGFESKKTAQAESQRIMDQHQSFMERNSKRV